MSHRISSLILSLSFLLAASSFAQERTLVLAVSEGTSGTIDGADVSLKYQPIADMIGAALKKNVTVLAARDFKRLEQSLSKQDYDFLLARPSDYPARAVRDYGYRYVASAEPEGHCVFIARPGATYKKLEDLKGQRIGLPEKAAYMNRFCAAELRDHGIKVDDEKLTTLRDQEGLVFSVRNGLLDAAGVASYSRAFREWAAAGNPVLHKSAPQPYLPLVASPKISPAQVLQVQAALKQAGSTPAGQAALRKIGVETFTTNTQERLDKLLRWLEE